MHLFMPFWIRHWNVCSYSSNEGRDTSNNVKLLLKPRNSSSDSDQRVHMSSGPQHNVSQQFIYILYVSYQLSLLTNKDTVRVVIFHGTVAHNLIFFNIYSHFSDNRNGDSCAIRRGNVQTLYTSNKLR